jgi:integrase
MAAHEAAMAGVEVRKAIGVSRTLPGSVNAAIVAYYNSDAFRVALKPTTQGMRRAILERFRVEHGDKRIAFVQTRHLVIILATKKPFAARNWLKTLRGLLQFAVAAELRPDDPTHGIKLARVKSDGIHTWTEGQIETFEAKHKPGTRARLAFALLLYTAQRRGDVIRMGRQHVREGEIAVRQEKTGSRLLIPIHAELQSALDNWPSEHLTFLTTERGEPFTAAGFGNWFRDQCNAAGLPKACSAHGLRKAACRRLAEAGCTAHQIAAISGHVSLLEVQRYTKAADQAQMARDAMRTMSEQTRTSIGKPGRRVCQNEG